MAVDVYLPSEAVIERRFRQGVGDDALTDPTMLRQIQEGIDGVEFRPENVGAVAGQIVAALNSPMPLATAFRRYDVYPDPQVLATIQQEAAVMKARIDVLDAVAPLSSGRSWGALLGGLVLTHKAATNSEAEPAGY